LGFRRCRAFAGSRGNTPKARQLDAHRPGEAWRITSMIVLDGRAWPSCSDVGSRATPLMMSFLISVAESTWLPPISVQIEPG